MVEYNLKWFDSYSAGINQWTSVYGEKEQKIETTTTTPTTISPVTGSTVMNVTVKTSTTTTPEPSSATLNAYNSLVILQLTVFAVLIKTYFL